MRFNSLLNRRFGKLVVIAEDGRAHRLCRCDCGNEKLIRSDALLVGKSTTCGICNRSQDRFKSVMGQRFGKLTVVEEHQVCRNRRVMVQCDCGEIVERVLANLKRGQTKSCGCVKDYPYTHGRIYYLADPRTCEVRYVGQTVQQPRVRLADHLGKGKTPGRIRYTPEKRAWIASLLPLKPLMVVVEDGVPLDKLTKVERLHIKRLRDRGKNLLNIHYAKA